MSTPSRSEKLIKINPPYRLEGVVHLVKDGDFAEFCLCSEEDGNLSVGALVGCVEGLHVTVDVKNVSDRFDFGEALFRLKQGKQVTRAGWNGNRQPERIHYSDGGVELDCEGPEKFKPRMFIFLDECIPRAEKHDGVRGRYIRPCLVMVDAQGYLVPGWLASQTDMLAEDWFELQEEEE